MDFGTINDIDSSLLLSINGSDSLFWDGCMKTYTTMGVWMPLALMLFYVFVKNNNIKDFFLLLIMFAAVFGLADYISSGLCKPFFERWRPTRDPVLMYIVDVVNNTRGKDFGFTSSHAANSFAIATFVMLVIKNRVLSISLLIWAGMNAYTRLYLGVHYPGDILAGTVIGVLTGWGMYRLYVYIKTRQKRSVQRDWISSQYTRSGYLVSDVYMLLLVMYATFAAIPMISFFAFKC